MGAKAGVRTLPAPWRETSPPLIPPRRISLRSATTFLNSSLSTDHASALQRVCSITRRTRLMRSQGCQRRALAVNDPPIVSSVTFGLRFSTAATCLLIASMQPSRVENA